MKKIVKGNDFTLKIPVMKMVDGQAQAFPLPACTDVVVQVCNQFKRIPLAFTIDVKEDNVLLARVEGDKMSLGTYAIEVKGKIFGNDWRSNEYPQFAIVSNNADADTEFGETDEGDNSVEMDTAMVILPPTVELSDLISDTNEALGKVDGAISKTDEAIKKANDAVSQVNGALEKVQNVDIDIDGTDLNITRPSGEKKEFDLMQLKGDKGDQGIKGDKGERGEKGDKGNAFTFADFTPEELASLKGEKGEKGDKGDKGLQGERGEQGLQGIQGEQGIKGDTGAQGEQGIQGVKGDPFTYSDFTEAQIKELQKPATDAATKAQEILKKAEAATADAEKVNAELKGNVLKVTNRNGEVKSLDFEQWDLEEKVNITISTSVEGVSIKGVIVNVFLNGATTSTKYTSDAEGKISFTVPRGTIYRISFQELKNCDPLPSLTYTAALRVRDINVEYKALSGETASVVVTIDKSENGSVKPLQGVSVTCEIANGDTTTTETNENGKVTFSIPWGKNYKITAGKAEGYYAFRGVYEKNNVADVAEHNLYYHFFPITSGVFILDTAGAQYTLDGWQESGKTAEDAVLVKITTQNLAEHNSSVGFSPSALQANYPNKAWCSQSILFSHIPLNGNNTKDALYYDGYESSKLIREEAQERGLTVPAFSYAYDCTVEMAGETLHGYVASVGQMAEMNINKTIVDNAIKALYGDTAKLFSPLFTRKIWTSTQASISNAYVLFNMITNDIKNYESPTVLPVFAC